MIDPETLIDGRYRVLSRLGSGGMADVYLAHDELLGREVAVKVLHHHFAEDQEFVERFKREASSAAALSHPNIVGIFDRGEWNGTYYIAMEYIAGRSLKQLVRETGAFEPAAAIEIVIQILRAARFAHRRGVIHRDLKPHNVILDEDGRARVTDFGIARAGASDMTLTGSIMGTAQYLSPEQAQGYAVSAASDIYSVGVILYELLTGVVPFEGETAVAIAFKQVSAVPRPPSELNPALPPSLDAVVLRALAKDPIERYADDDELIAALEAERAQLPEGGTPYDGHAPALGPQDPPTGVMLAPALAYGEDRPPEEDQEGRRRWVWWVVGTAVALAAVLVAVLLLGGKGKVTVPDVTGQNEQTADSILRRAGLNPVPQLQSSSTVPTGLVISQSPEANKRVDSGSRVNLVVSGGPASVPVPDVEGFTEADALKKLKKAGFKPRTTKEASATVAAGKVIGTNPPAGTVEQLGSGVEVLVSSGPAPVTVPDVTGQSQSAAEMALTNAELELGTVTKRASGDQQPGTVLSQSPAGGAPRRPRARSTSSSRKRRRKWPSRTSSARARTSPRARSNRQGSRSGPRPARRAKPGRWATCCARARAPARRRRKARRSPSRSASWPPKRPRRRTRPPRHRPRRRRPAPEMAAAEKPASPDARADADGGASLRVAVLAGGRSSEHDVSLASAASVRDALTEAGHEAIWIEISRDGVWRRDGRAIALSPGEGLEGADVVFPALHGPFGEDGTIQGLLETLLVPYVGAGVAASAVCMDKVLFKDLMASLGVPQVAYAGISAARWREDRAGALREAGALGLPVFVKPAHLGSSVGIVKVARAEELEDALAVAFEHDERAIVEAAAGGIEVECGVLEREAGAEAGGLLASEPGEIVFEREFYDYEAKYTPGGMELLVPARITAGARALLTELATRAFRAAGCAGLARVDFFVDGEQVLVNELNTMPGFTPTSVYPKLLAASGVAYPELVDRLCRLGVARHAAAAARRH